MLVRLVVPATIPSAESVTNQAATASGNHRCSETQPDTTMPLTCSNATYLFGHYYGGQFDRAADFGPDPLGAGRGGVAQPPLRASGESPGEKAN